MTLLEFEQGGTFILLRIPRAMFHCQENSLSPNLLQR